jgi:hypothetical protein
MRSRCSWLVFAGVFAVALVPWLVLSPPVRAEGKRLVLAFYYPWYDHNTWGSGKVSDIPSAPYNSDDSAVMARQIDQAQSAGINAFVLNWWGTKNRTEKNLKSMLDVAAQKGFRIAVDFDINSPVMAGVSSYADNLRHLLSVHASHPGYLHFEGRPVVFFYNVSRLSVGTWQNLRAQADPEHHALWIAEGTNLNYQAVFDGHHLYSITWPNRIPPAQTLSKFGKQVRKYNREHGTDRLWVATVMPGYDDTRARPRSGFARTRDGGDYYRQCWQAAIASKPQWVVINSFNEWVEGSQIEPSQAYGGFYLDLTREWAANYRAADFSAVTQPPSPPPPTPTERPPTPDPPEPPAVAPTPRPRPPTNGRHPSPQPF